MNSSLGSRPHSRSNSRNGTPVLASIAWRRAASGRRWRSSSAAWPIVAISSTPMPPIVVGTNSSGIWPSSEPAISGRNDGSSPKSSMMFLQLVEIPRRQMASRQHIDPSGIAAGGILRGLDQHFDHARHGLLPTVLERVLEVGGRDIDHRECREFRMLLPDRLDVALDVIALGFGDAGRADADDLRLGALVDVENCLFDILVTAEHGRDFAHRRGLQRHGFLEMPHEQGQPERGAALRAVQQRHRIRAIP